MDDGAQAVVEDGVVLVFTVLGITDFAALFAAVELFVAEVPAARALKKIPAERGHVADLGSRRRAGGLRKGGVLLVDDRMLGELRQRDQRADFDPFVVFTDLVET